MDPLDALRLPNLPNLEEETSLRRTFRPYQFHCDCSECTQFDPNNGPYGLEGLSAELQQIFREISRQYETVFLTDFSLHKHVEARQLLQDRRLTEAKNVAVEYRAEILDCHWYYQFSRFLNDSSNKVKEKADEWLRHGKFAHYFSPALLTVKERLDNLEKYTNNSLRAVRCLKARHISLNNNKETIEIPGSVWLTGQMRSIKNPFHLCENFIQTYENYLNELLRTIGRENERLAWAMLERLKVASKTNNLAADDVLFYKFQELQREPLDQSSWKPFHSTIRTPTKARCLMTPEAFNLFYAHISSFGTKEAQKELKEYGWTWVRGGNIRMLYRTGRKTDKLTIYPHQLHPQPNADEFIEAVIDTQNESSPSFDCPSVYEVAEYNLAMRDICEFTNPARVIPALEVVNSFLKKLKEKLARFEGMKQKSLPIVTATLWSNEIKINLQPSISSELKKISARFLDSVQTKDLITLQASIPAKLVENLLKLAATINDGQIKDDLDKAYNKLILFVLVKLREGIVSRDTLNWFSIALAYADACAEEPVSQAIQTLSSLLLQTNCPSSWREVEKMLKIIQRGDEILNTMQFMKFLADTVENPDIPLFKIIEDYERETGHRLAEQWLNHRMDAIKGHFIVIEKALTGEVSDGVTDAVKQFIPFARLVPGLNQQLSKKVEEYLRTYQGSETKLIQLFILFNRQDWLQTYGEQCLNFLLTRNPSVLVDNEAITEQVLELFQRCPSLQYYFFDQLYEGFNAYLTKVAATLDICLKDDPHREDTPMQSLDISLSGMTYLIETYCKASDHSKFLERLDAPYLMTLKESLQHPHNALPFLHWQQVVQFNYPLFPRSPLAQKAVVTIIEEVVSQPWCLTGYLFCESYYSSHSRTSPNLLVQRYRVKWFKKLLEEINAVERKVHLNRYKSFPRGRYELLEFFGETCLPEVYGLIKECLQGPLADISLLELLIPCFTKEATTDQEYDNLRIRLESLDVIHREAQAVLSAIRDDKDLAEPLNCLRLSFLARNTTSNIQFAICHLALSEAIYYFKERIARRYFLEQASDAINRIKHYMINPSLFDHFPNLSQDTEKQGLISLQQQLDYLCENAEAIHKLNSLFSVNLDEYTLVEGNIDWLQHFSEKSIPLIDRGFTKSNKTRLQKALALIPCELISPLHQRGLRAIDRFLAGPSTTDYPSILRTAQLVRYQIYYRNQSTEAERSACLAKIKASEVNVELAQEMCIIVSNPTPPSHTENTLWLRCLNRLLSAQRSHNEEFKVVSACVADRYIGPAIYSQLFTRQHRLVRDKGTNRHVVIPINLEGTVVVHAKFKPDSPGTQRITSSLRYMLLRKRFPHHDLLRFPAALGKEKKDYPVLLTEHVQGMTLAEMWRKGLPVLLDHQAYSEEVLRAMFDREQDGKPENYIFNAGQLWNIDNDQALSREIEIKNNRVKIVHKSVLYCFDEMNLPVHPAVVQRILSLDPYTALQELLLELDQYNERYAQLFNPDECTELFTKDRKNPILIPIPIQAEFILETYGLIMRMKEIFERRPTITHLDLLKSIYPLLANYYACSFNQHKTPAARFAAVTKNEYQLIRDPSGGHSAYSTVAMASNPVYLSLLDTTVENRLVNIKEATKSLEEHEQQMSQLRSVRASLLLSGNIKPFEELTTNSLREKIINGEKGRWDPILLRFKPLDIQRCILELLQRFPFSKLLLSGCELLDDLTLEKILSASPFLEVLDISRCVKISSWFIATIPYRCPSLKILNLSGLPIQVLSGTYQTRISDLLRSDSRPRFSGALPFHCLERLYIDQCTHLQQVNIFAPRLTRLKGKTCTALRQFDLYIPMIDYQPTNPLDRYFQEISTPLRLQFSLQTVENCFCYRLSPKPA